MKGSKDAKNFYYPAVLLIAGLFIITGHLGYLDIPRSYDHMSYSTLASLFKIEGTYPVFNIYAFPSAVYCPVPFGWVSMVAFISDLIKVSIPRAQLILVMTFFPFLGVGIYHTTKLIFNSRGWAFSAGLLALVMRMSSIAPTDGDMPEVLEWVLVSFGLFALFTFLNDKDRRYLIFSVISFVISFFLHVKLVLYTLAGLLVSIPIVLIKRNFKESRHVILIYLMFIVMITIVLLPYIISMKGGGLLGMTTLSLLEFFENMIFRHGFIMLFTVVLGIPFFARSKNPVIIFCFAYFLMFFLYFDQWILWELLKPKWYVVTLFPCINFFGAVGTYTSFFRFLSSYSQIFSAFNIILPILFIYSAYKLIPRRFIKIARIVFILFLIYESGIRPEVPVQLIGKSDLNTAQWIREETDKHTAFIANVGSDPSYLWNISGITERKCLNYRPLYFEYLEGKDPLSGIDFERLLKDNPIKAARLLKDNKFTHLLISEEAILIDCNFNEKQGFREIYKSDVDGKVSRVYKLL